MRVLTINGGSSSIKFALFESEGSLKELFKGQIENLIDQEEILDSLIGRLENHNGLNSIDAIGHRIVHGMDHKQPQRITPSLLEELKRISAFDPEHLPEEIKLIEAFGKRFPTIPQIACFDTSFHASMPPVAKRLPLPRRFNTEGIRRYGFHGLSYSYLLHELARIAGHEKANGRLILAHLGNGASLAAVKHGRSVDTSMGFTPTSGLPMGTRTGDLDPGVASYLMQSEAFSPEQFNHLVNYESGLLGISETSSDMRELIKLQHKDSRAAEAIELFSYQTKKWIGSFAAALGGLDTLVFSGGIGENAPEVRGLICQGLQFLGIDLDGVLNFKNEGIISTETSRVCVRVIRTNEELMIAGLVCDVWKNTDTLNNTNILKNANVPSDATVLRNTDVLN
jgi:acetate kinase